MKKFLYWAAHITWGFITFLIGAIAAIVALCCKCKRFKFGYSVVFISKSMSGSGFSLGPFIFISSDCEYNYDMMRHEHGHGIQTLFFGPLMLIVVAIPSVLRFWFREIQLYHWTKQKESGKITQDKFSELVLSRPSYDSAWFENQATNLGDKYFSNCIIN